MKIIRQYLRTIIVEDEKNNADTLFYLLKEYCPEIIVEGIAKNLKEAKELINSKKPDLAFLDIHIKDRLIFELFDDNHIPDYQIIFTTVYNKYTIDAFKLNTVDYLLKPICFKKLKEVVKRAINTKKVVERAINTQKIFDQKVLEILKNSIFQNKIEINKLAVSSLKEILLVKKEDIVSLSANARYTLFNFASGEEVISTKNLGEYEKYLEAPTFFKIHKSHIINLNHLVKISKEEGDYCSLSNGKILPIAKRRKEDLKKILNF
jgi:two-component system LytT family response regulator